MARKLELDIGSDSTAARAGLTATAKAVDHLAAEADRLQREFRQAERAAAGLDKQLLQTKVAAAALAREFAKTGDSGVKKELDAQRVAAKELARLRSDIIGSTEVDAARAGRAWRKAMAQLRRTASDSGPAFQALPINPQTAVAGAAAGTALAPLVGGAAGGAVIGVGALGAVGLGVAGAAQSKEVADQWIIEAGRVKASWLEASKAFEGPTLAAAGEFRKAMESVDLDEILRDASKFVAPLAAGVANAITYLGDGFEDLVDNAGPVVAELGHGISETGKAIGTALSDISGEADGGAAALRDLFKVINGFIVGTGRFIAFFEASYEKLKIFQSGVNDAYRAVADNSVGPIHAAAELGAAISGTGLEADAFGRAIEGAGVKMDDFGKIAGDSFYGLDARARDAAEAVERLNRAFQDAKGAMLGLNEANIAAAQALADLKEGFRAGAGALDIATEKGRENMTLVDRLIQGYIDQREAAIRAGGGTQEAYDKARATYNNQITALEALLVKLGLSATAAHNLMSQFYDKDVTVTVRVKQVGAVSQQGVIFGGDLRRNAGQAYASGTDWAKAGLALVGERGPELVNFRGGEVVLNAGETARMMAGNGRAAAMLGMGSGAGASTRVTVDFAGLSSNATGIDRFLGDWFMRSLRIGQIHIYASNVIPV